MSLIACSVRNLRALEVVVKDGTIAKRSLPFRRRWPDLRFFGTRARLALNQSSSRAVYEITSTRSPTLDDDFIPFASLPPRPHYHATSQATKSTPPKVADEELATATAADYEPEVVFNDEVVASRIDGGQEDLGATVIGTVESESVASLEDGSAAEAVPATGIIPGPGSRVHSRKERKRRRLEAKAIAAQQAKAPKEEQEQEQIQSQSTEEGEDVHDMTIEQILASGEAASAPVASPGVEQAVKRVKSESGLKAKEAEKSGTLQSSKQRPSRSKNHSTNGSTAMASKSTLEPRKEREPWQTNKSALEEKFGEQEWKPRKRISPDALEGIRALHASQPDVYSTPMLANHFKVSPEAIRRILKSKWQPKEDEERARRERWERRGEKKWSEMVELGIRPPKKWREMGVGRAENGELPLWKKPARQIRSAGERWIEHPDTEAAYRAADARAAGHQVPSLVDRIL